MLQQLPNRVRFKGSWIWIRILDGHVGGERNAFARHAERLQRRRQSAAFGEIEYTAGRTGHAQRTCNALHRIGGTCAVEGERVRKYHRVQLSVRKVEGSA